MRKLDSFRLYIINMKIGMRLYFKDEKDDETFNDFYFDDYSDEDELIEEVEKYLNLKNIEATEEDIRKLRIIVSIYYKRSEKNEKD